MSNKFPRIVHVGSDGKERKPKVLVALPNDGWFHASLLAQVMQFPLDQRVACAFMIQQDRPIDHNRNIIARYFLTQPFDFMVTIDSDNPCVKSVLDLVFLDKDVVSCPTPIYNPTDPKTSAIKWNVFDVDDAGTAHPHDYKTGGGLQQIQATGLGCVVIARRVLEKLGNEAFSCDRKDGLVTLGTDLAFSRRCRDAGFELWVHYDYPCQHFRVNDLFTIATMEAASREKKCQPIVTSE